MKIPRWKYKHSRKKVIINGHETVVLVPKGINPRNIPKIMNSKPTGRKPGGSLFQV